ncbi:MAG: MFS transporter [Clostridium sp.]|uniref:MFS transporter n=1 Tax=Clostridium sp. TaxID=1506 RepID=UPI00302B3C41
MEKKTQKFVLIMFLLGIFIGAMDTGIVSPARGVISNGLGISTNTSIWIITIYTLAYAVVMPISGKLSDKYGKKKLFMYSIIIFGIGSTLCGVSNFIGGFPLLIAARIIQAVGGGGIMPIATAYIGDSFPQEKRGSALGLVGATYGIATTLGPTIGSALLNFVGNENWGVLFFINVPICIAVVLMSLKIKETESVFNDKKMDVKGSIVVSGMILSLMYALTNLQFHDFLNSIKSTSVYPFLLIFAVLIPLFIYLESKAEDPILNLNYFKDRNIAITLMLSFIVGCGLMGIVFVPQFAENVLKIKVGSGGYLVTLMALFTGVASPLGGKLIDKYSAKLILLIGFASTAIGTLILALGAAPNSSQVALYIGLAFMGLGMGFTMGTPLNYLMQSFVDRSETSSAQSTLSLVRSIGVAISPNILVNFVSQAGQDIPGKLMQVMPPIPGVEGGMSALAGQGSLPTDILNSLQNADVTTITDVLKNFSATMFDKAAPSIQAGLAGKLPPHTSAETVLNGMKDQYIGSVESIRTTLENTFQQTMNSGFAKLFIVAAIIAIVGFVLSMMLKNKKKEEIVK